MASHAANRGLTPEDITTDDDDTAEDGIDDTAGATAATAGTPDFFAFDAGPADTGGVGGAGADRPRPRDAPGPGAGLLGVRAVGVRVLIRVLGPTERASAAAAEPAAPADPAESANAAGIAATAEPTPRATASAPTRPI